ncbi:MAG: hypothetical protein KF901_22405 [Myxococcales bacterium]|nr:hypothetical protein [Myxococcales bacterium]
MTWTHVGLLVVALAVGCAHDHDHYGEGACGDIAAACHDVDTGTGRVSECHALGHDGPVETCELERDECLAVCVAAGER